MRGNMMIKYLYRPTLEDGDSISEISSKLKLKNGRRKIRNMKIGKAKKRNTQNTDE